MSKLMFSILLTPLIQLQNASQCGGVTQVALHQLVEVSTGTPQTFKSR